MKDIKKAPYSEVLPLDGLDTMDGVTRVSLPLEPPKGIRDNAGLSARRMSINVGSSLLRVGITSLVALLVPAYLVHRLPSQTYGAWVLILQLAAFVSYLDAGVQTGVAKFVAEYSARGNEAQAGTYASAGLIITTFAAAAGVLLTGIIAWQVPRLFHDMPPSLYGDVRISLFLVGGSLSVGLICSVFSAVFAGLQRYSIPMMTAILGRLLFTLAVVASVSLHQSLRVMAIAVAGANVVSGIVQVAAWRLLAQQIPVSFKLVQRTAMTRMARYCSQLAVWTFGMLFVSGLDVTIVGHYDFRETSFYSIAVLPTSFMLLVITSILGPMLPAASALSTHRSPAEMGSLLIQMTRYSTVMLFLTGLTLVVFGLPLLRLWVGPTYATHSLMYLRILVLANVVRSFCAPYATMLVATGKQAAATFTAISEAVVNVTSSLYLAHRFGAIGVAFGTLLGSFISILCHFVVSMHYSRDVLELSRARLLINGLTQPALILIPSLALLPFWWHAPWSPSKAASAAVVALMTLLIAWFAGLRSEDRSRLRAILQRSHQESPFPAG